MAMKKWSKRALRKGEQLTLAGRKPAAAKRRDVPHRARPKLDGKNHPVHVTVRVKRAVGVPSLRREVVRDVFAEVLRETADDAFQVVHHSLQHDHVHLIVEARDAKALSAGMSSFAIRVAKRLNATLGRRGAMWSGRYHRHDLCSPREVAHAIVYVLQNAKKHGEVPRDAAWLDAYSSAAQFDGWVDVEISADAIERPPRTWLLRIGYRRTRIALCTSMAPKVAA